tara:strand:- start:153 stop:353 length:201 start_codon:yes stop_codon:yes gene_type:complete
MSIGDKVKLKDIPANNRGWLSAYKNLTGRVVDFQTRTDHKPPIYVRVSFKKDCGYEDLAAWRVTQA